MKFFALVVASPLAANALLPESAPRFENRHIFHRQVETSIPLNLKTRQRNGPSRRDVTSIKQDAFELEYIAPVTIDGKSFDLLIDTGSPDTWVTATNLTCTQPDGDACPKPEQLSVPSTEKSLGNFVISYVDGAGISGGYIKRPVKIGNFEVKNQIIGLGWDAKSFPDIGPTHGILGLSKRRTGFNYTTLFFNMIDTHILPENSFSIVLFGNADIDGVRDGGYLTFGGIPKAVKPTSKWASAPLVDPDGLHTYTIAVDGFKVGGKAVTGLTTFQKEVVVDSGSTYSWVDDHVALALWDAMPGKGDDPAKACSIDDLTDPTVKCLNDEVIWKVPCDGKLPEFTVTVGGIDFAVKKENLVVEILEGICFLGVQPARNGTGILGQTFMRGVISAFDFKNEGRPEIHFAKYEVAK